MWISRLLEFRPDLPKHMALPTIPKTMNWPQEVHHLLGVGWGKWKESTVVRFVSFFNLQCDGMRSHVGVHDRIQHSFYS